MDVRAGWHIATAPTTHPLRVAGLLWSESRPIVQIVFALRFWVAVVAVAPDLTSLRPDVLLMGLSCSALTMATYLANGVYDLTEDVANGSTRPLACGQLRPQTARSAALALTVVGLLLAAATGSVALLLLALLSTTLGWGYSTGTAPLKCSTLGACVAAVGGGACAYAAGSLSTGAPVSPEHVLVFVLLSLWMAVGGASKDLGDARGDRLAGRRTLPVLVGDVRARGWIAAGALLLGLLAAAGMLHHPVVTAPLALLVAGALWVGAACLRSPGGADRAARRHPYRAFMVAQYAANTGLLVHSLS